MSRPFRYLHQDLISEYNTDLFNEVSAKIPIELVKNMTTPWSAKIKDNKAIITYKKSEYPDACFAHELLHIKYELLGLKLPLVMDKEKVTEHLGYIFNQLCHLKFYKEFWSMGFGQEEFLDESDIVGIKLTIRDSINYLKELHQKNGRLDGSLKLLYPYLVLKSPHDFSDWSRNQIMELMKIADPKFFHDLDKIILEWVQNPSMDCSLTLARIFKACGIMDVGFCISGKKEDLIFSRSVDI